MTVTIDLPEDALARLQAEAKRRGVSIDVVVAELTQALPTDASASLSFIGLGSSTSGRARRRRAPRRRLRPRLTPARR